MTLLGGLSVLVFGLPAGVVILICGAPASIAVYLLTHRNRPPKGRIFGNTWVLFAFIMCVFWIYALAKELVTCLSSLGDILHVPPAILGLTLLAWGNSVGDLSSNVAVAVKGYGEMAIAGCYAGPIFELLVGLGISFFIVSAQGFPAVFRVNLDASSWVSILFSYISLFSTLFIVRSQGHRFNLRLGICLISLYCIYTFVQLILLLYIVLVD